MKAGHDTQRSPFCSTVCPCLKVETITETLSKARLRILFCLVLFLIFSPCREVQGVAFEWFKKVYPLPSKQELQREQVRRRRGVLHALIEPSNGCNGRGWTKLKPGCRGFFKLSNLGGEASGIWVICCFPKHISRELEGCGAAGI